MTDAGRLIAAVMRQGHSGHTEHGGAPAGGVPKQPFDINAVGGDGGHNMGHGMTPFLFGDKRNFFVLFSQARVTSAGGLAIAIVCSLLFALLSTLFSNWSKIIELKAAKKKCRVSPLLAMSTVTFSLRIALHYIAMLLVMTMNVWVIIAVVVGHGLGHILFAILFDGKKDEEGKDFDSVKVVDDGCEC